MTMFFYPRLDFYFQRAILKINVNFVTDDSLLTVVNLYH